MQLFWDKKNPLKILFFLEIYLFFHIRKSIIKVSIKININNFFSINQSVNKPFELGKTLNTYNKIAFA